MMTSRRIVALGVIAGVGVALNVSAPIGITVLCAAAFAGLLRADWRRHKPPADAQPTEDT